MSLRQVSVALACLCGAAACSKKPEPPHRTEPWLAHPSASQSASAVGAPARSYHFAPDSSVRFSVSGRKGEVSGRAPVTAGTLRLDPRNLESTSADVVVDLTRLTMDAESLPATFEGSATSPSALALNWLELGPAVSPEKRARLASARFVLSSVEGNASALDLGARKPRPVRVTAVGTLLIHGFRAPVRADVSLVSVSGESGAPPRLAIRSTSPLVLPLAPHDIGARGPDGVADALGTARAADWVGKSVKLEVELTAESDP